MALLIRPGSNLWRIDPLPKNAQIIEGSLAELPLKEIERFAPDTVVHAAWNGVTNEHRNDPAQTENVTLTAGIADLGCKHFIGLGSQAEYGPLNKKIRETDKGQPTTAYGRSKFAAHIVTRNMYDERDLDWSWLCVFSTYGPREDPSWMIPYVIRELLAGKTPALTACEQRWDYLFGPDAADAIWSVIKAKATGLFNLGSGRAESLRKIVETLRDEIDPALPVAFGRIPYRPDQVMHLEADISKLTKATGWTPATSLEEGLKQTVAWHRQQLA